MDTSSYPLEFSLSEAQAMQKLIQDDLLQDPDRSKMLDKPPIDHDSAEDEVISRA
jgi:hypothetical protein